MQVQDLVLDLSCFHKIFAQSKIRLRAKHSEQDLFRLVSAEGYYAPTLITKIEEMTPPHYCKTLLNLLKMLNQQQESKAQGFLDLNLNSLINSRWIRSRHLTKLGKSIKDCEMNEVEEIFKLYGIQETHPKELATCLRLLQQIYENMFVKSITAIIASHLEHQAGKDERQTDRARNLPAIIKNSSELLQYCCQLKIVLKEQLVEAMFEAVLRVGLGSNRINSLIKSVTFPAYEEELNALLVKIPSMSSKITLTIELLAVYAFLEEQYFLDEKFIGTLIDAYFLNAEQYDSMTRQIGLEEQIEHYTAINKLLSSFIDNISHEIVKQIKIEQIKVFNYLAKLFYRVRQSIKGIESIELRRDIVQQLLNGDQPMMLNDLQGNYHFTDAKNRFDEITESLAANVTKQLKKVIEFYTLGDFSGKDFMEIMKLFQKEKDPSLYIHKIYEQFSNRQLSFRSYDTSEHVQEEHEDRNSSIYSEKVESKIIKSNHDGISSKSEIRCWRSKEEEEQILKEFQQSQTLKKRMYLKAEKQDLCTYLVLLVSKEQPEKVILRDQVHGSQRVLRTNKFSESTYCHTIIQVRSSELDRYKLLGCFKNHQKTYKGLIKRLSTSGVWLVNEQNDQEQPLNGAFFFSLFLLVNHQISAQQEHINDYQQQMNEHSQIITLYSQQPTSQTNPFIWLQASAQIIKGKFDGTINFQHLSQGCSESPLYTMLYVCLMYFVFGPKTYDKMKKSKLVMRLRMITDATNFITNKHRSWRELVRLYRKLHLKQLLTIGAPQQKCQIRSLLRSILEHEPSILNMKKLQKVIKLYPQLTIKLHSHIFNLMLSQSEFDVYDLIVVKMAHMKFELDNQESNIKFRYFTSFLEELSLFATKESRKSQETKGTIVRHMINQVEHQLMEKNYFFSRKICLDNLMVLQLYRQSKILARKLPEIGESLVWKLLPHLTLGEQDQDLDFKILVLLSKPVSHSEQNKLRAFFKLNKIPFGVVRYLYDFELHELNLENYEIQQLTYLLIQHIITNPHTDLLLEQIVGYLDKQYTLSNEEEKLHKIKQKLKLALKRMGQVIAQSHGSQLAAITKKYQQIGKELQNIWVRKMLYQQIDYDNGCINGSNYEIRVRSTMLQDIERGGRRAGGEKTT